MVQVCEDWFSRMRMLLLRTSAAGNNHALTLHHAYARLGDLKTQLRHLQLAATAELAQQQQAEKQMAEQQLAEQQQVAKENADKDKASKETAVKEQAERQQPASEEAGRQQTAADTLSLPGRPVSSVSASSSKQKPSQTSSDHTSGRSDATPAPLDSAAVPAPLGTVKQSVRAIPKSLLEIQAEQAAESAQQAAAQAAASSPAQNRSKKQGQASSASSPAPATSSDKSQAKVLQVKRPKPGQTPTANATPGSLRVVPLMRNAAGKVAVADNPFVQQKVKLMARPQVLSSRRTHMFQNYACMLGSKTCCEQFFGCSNV